MIAITQSGLRSGWQRYIEASDQRRRAEVEGALMGLTEALWAAGHGPRGVAP